MSKDSPKDLKVRTASAIVMIAVAGSALWAGGWVFTTFVAIVAAGLLWEWWGLISKFNQSWWGRALWMLGGLVYVGGAAIGVIAQTAIFPAMTFLFIGLVVSVDSGAYLAGRFVGGAKIAPEISPSKTWSGLVGGTLLAVAWVIAIEFYWSHSLHNWVLAAIMSCALAVFAQTGDFFESWLKRKAGVKDSGNLIPGHGGMFDRLDGYIPVFAVVAVMITLNNPEGF